MGSLLRFSSRYPRVSASRVKYIQNDVVKDGSLSQQSLVLRFQSDESYILPVLLRFDGQPELDEEVYKSSSS